MQRTSSGSEGAEPDYFAVFGLPRRLGIDTADLEATYHRLSRDVHPDFHLNKSVEEQARLLARSARVNQAYRTLKDFHSRVEYLIELEGGGALKPSAPPELLEDVIEVQELIEACRRGSSGGNAESARRLAAEAERLREKLAALEANLDAAAGDWDADEGVKKATLSRLQEVMAQRVYVVNLLRDIDAVETQGA